MVFGASGRLADHDMTPETLKTHENIVGYDEFRARQSARHCFGLDEFMAMFSPKDDPEGQDAA